VFVDVVVVAVVAAAAQPSCSIEQQYDGRSSGQEPSWSHFWQQPDIFETDHVLRHTLRPLAQSSLLPDAASRSTAPESRLLEYASLDGVKDEASVVGQPI